MRYTAGEVFKALKKEGVMKFERGVIVNEDENSCLVQTKQGNLYILKQNFFDYYSIDEVVDLCYGVEVHNRFEMYRNKKSKVKHMRNERINAKNDNCRIV